MNLTPYTAHFDVDGRPYVDGPGDGMTFYGGTLHPDMRFSDPRNAGAAAKCCNEAYRMGVLAAQREMRKALGIEKGGAV